MKLSNHNEMRHHWKFNMGDSGIKPNQKFAETTYEKSRFFSTSPLSNFERYSMAGIPKDYLISDMVEQTMDTDNELVDDDDTFMVAYSDSTSDPAQAPLWQAATESEAPSNRDQLNAFLDVMKTVLDAAGEYRTPLQPIASRIPGRVES